MSAHLIRAALLATLFQISASAQSFDLAALSLEDLMDIEVRLASRRAEPRFQVPAAIFVLTGEEIRRSGATSIPEALRLVPGLQVARIDANKWAVSARGFNGRYANKLLILIDGRSAYTPLFSGVYWEVQDVLLEDVEQIEIIRGPGATLWGANAVNGVINIVTRSARDTQGLLTSAGAGSEERAFARARYGFALGERTAVSTWGTAFSRDAQVDAAGTPTADDWRMLHAGFRADRDALVLLGGLYRGETGQTYRLASLLPPYLRVFDEQTQLWGAHLLGRWQQRAWSLQVYYDRSRWDDALYAETRDTWDLDFQHTFAPRSGHHIVWGAGYRYTRDRLRNSPTVRFDPERRGNGLLSVFAQDEIALFAESARLVLGTKLEHNAYTGVEVQPNARLYWSPGARHALWAAAASAVRTPSRAGNDLRLDLRAFPPDSLFRGSPPALAAIFGNRDLKAERLTAFEAGYRLGVGRDLFADLALFYNRYDNARAVSLGPIRQESGPPPHLLLPLQGTNWPRSGRAFGGELAADGRPLSSADWRLRAAYSFLEIDLRLDPNLDPVSAAVEGESPQHQFYVWSMHNLRPDWHLDAMLRYTHELPAKNIGAYLTLDLRLAWKVLPALELALVGRNLLDDRHPEFHTFFVDTLPTETQREVYGLARWEF